MVRMLPFYWFGFFVLVTSFNQVVADVEHCPVAGSAFNLTCTGPTDGNCDWSKDGTPVMQCIAGSICSGSSGYTGYRISDRQYVLQIHILDKATHDGLFECKQGGNNFIFPLVVVTEKPSDDLSGTCQDGTVECTLTNHGDPAVTLQLKEGSTVLTSTNTGGRVSHAGEDGKTYTCELNETSCVTNTRKDVTCQATTISPTTPSEPTTATPTSTATTTSTEITKPVCENVIICIIVGCIGGVAVVTVIFICCCCCPCCLPSCFPSKCPCCCRGACKKKRKTGGTNGQTRTTSAEGKEGVPIDDYPTSEKTGGDYLKKRNGGADSEDILIKIPDGQSDGMRDDRVPKPDGRSEVGMHRL